MIAEQIHRYPRWISWPIELLAALGVIATLAMFGRDLLRYLVVLETGALIQPSSRVFHSCPSSTWRSTASGAPIAS